MKWWKKILGLLVSVLFLALALKNVDWEKIPAILQTIRPWYLVPVFLSLNIEVLLRGIRWHFILGRDNIPVSACCSGWVIGAFFNNLFPARAGEFARSFYFSRKTGISAAEAFGSVILERFLDGIVVMSFIAIAFTMHAVNPALQKAGYTAGLFYTMVLVGILLMQFRKDWFDAVLGLVLRPFPASWQAKILRLQDSFVNGFALIRQPGRLVKVIALSYAAWLFSLLSYYLMFWVFALELGIRGAFLLIAVISIGAMIPSSPGMIGIYEYCCVVALSQILGLPHELAVTFGIFAHSMGYFFFVFVGAAILFFENLSIGEIRRQSEETEPVSPP
jgi:hypothetical protein